MQNLSGLLLASVMLCAGGVQAAPLNMHMHTPTMQVKPQPHPPAGITGAGTGKVNKRFFGINNSGNPDETLVLGFGKIQTQYHRQTGTHHQQMGTRTFKPMHPPQPCRGC